MSEKRCCLYIDIEGFGALWNSGDSLHLLNNLMLGIHNIGTYCYPLESERLFAHQFGDAFAIVSCFEECNLERFISIAVALMQHVLHSGGMARGSISEGGWSDIHGCYPREVTAPIEGGIRPMGTGIMTRMSVMGSALINAVNIDKKGPRGPLILIDSSLDSKIQKSPFAYTICNNETDWNGFAVDWVHFTSTYLDYIKDTAKLTLPRRSDISGLITDYLNKHTLSEKPWAKEINGLLSKKQ